MWVIHMYRVMLVAFPTPDKDTLQRECPKIPKNTLLTFDPPEGFTQSQKAVWSEFLACTSASSSQAWANQAVSGPVAHPLITAMSGVVDEGECAHSGTVVLVDKDFQVFYQPDVRPKELIKIKMDVAAKEKGMTSAVARLRVHFERQFQQTKAGYNILALDAQMKRTDMLKPILHVCFILIPHGNHHAGGALNF